MPVKLLAFTGAYFSESGFFNGLRAKKITKISGEPRLAQRLLSRALQAAMAPQVPPTCRRAGKDPAHQNNDMRTFLFLSRHFARGRFYLQSMLFLERLRGSN
jgi:hypothetical protein